MLLVVTAFTLAGAFILVLGFYGCPASGSTLLSDPVLEITDHEGTSRIEEVTTCIGLLTAARLKQGMAVSIHESPRSIVIHWPDQM